MCVCVAQVITATRRDL